MEYIEIFLVIFSLLFLFCYFFHKKDGLPTNWPVIGMLPAVSKNYHRIHDYAVEVLEKSQLTFLGKGPWFTNMKFLFTVDPANVHHILSKNFGNYPRGSKFKEISEFLIEKVWEKIESRLIPFLDHASEQQFEIDLQDLFERFSFDTISTVVMDYDPESLSIDLPNLPFLKAVRDFEEVIVYRHAVPTCVWKFQRWLDIGQEKKHREAWKIIDDFIYGCISKKREEMSKNSKSKACKVGNEVGADLMTIYMDEVRKSAEIGSNGEKFLRDTILAFFFAGRGTVGVGLVWFFYLLSENPHVLSKIKEELDAMTTQMQYHHTDDDIMWNRYKILSTNFQDLKDKLIYLHATICEALRLYPPVAFNTKVPIEPDTLPSGHKVDSSMQIIFSTYAMGRMKSLWGEDCCEFKPERWMLETDKIRYVPSHKFLAFSSGPRTCLGKNMSLTVMKAATIAIISRYHIEPVQAHPVVPETSMVLHMKQGFKVKVAAY
ncbi:hypothetical protein Cgig2_033580 [Carnegiea gigantea]|uniref:Cytochrome P450 n=1 Tax=Carnegiea gigantea TaxID=171969 RepID=A0A9Q1KM33_9CARY|nr:hypothetical protein Cgig2_033580 [Carnegiea gigantea]